MKQLRVVLFSSILAWVPASALAQDIDMKPMAGMSSQEAIAARKAAREHWDRMTRQERLDAVRAARGKKRDELTALDQYAKQQMALRAEHEGAVESPGAR